MTISHTRQLAAQPGVQLNPLRDSSALPVLTTSDQVFATVGRFPRGRIDKPFRVNRSNLQTRLGKGEPLRAFAANEAYVHVAEAVNKGAYEAVVYRLSTTSAKLQWITVRADGTAEVSDEPPVGTNYLFGILHRECFSDGIKVAFHADEVKENGVAVGAKLVKLRLMDSDSNVLYEFQGSFDSTAGDGFGNSIFMPNVVSTLMPDGEVEVVVPATAGVTTVPTDSPGYGRDANGREKWATTPVVYYFTEGPASYSLENSYSQSYFETGGFNYTADDYSKARVALTNCEFDFNYISSAGSRAAALILQLVQLAYDTNKILKVDVPGEYTPEQAITWVNMLNVTAKEQTHLVHFYWSPQRHDCPIGLNGKVVLGTSTLNIAKSCMRNAQVNAKGFAPKNYPIAGAMWPMDRSGVKQIYSPTEQELSDLALAGINPVLYERYSDGGRYVWTDSLTSNKGNSLAKLMAVADMSTDIDDRITRFAKGMLQLPMQTFLKRMDDFLNNLLAGADASGWLVPSGQLGGASFAYEVKPDEARPYDRVQVKAWVSYDGTVRQVFVTQELVGRR